MSFAPYTADESMDYVSINKILVSDKTFGELSVLDKIGLNL